MPQGHNAIIFEDKRHTVTLLRNSISFHFRFSKCHLSVIIPLCLQCSVTTDAMPDARLQAHWL